MLGPCWVTKTPNKKSVGNLCLALVLSSNRFWRILGRVQAYIGPLWGVEATGGAPIKFKRKEFLRLGVNRPYWFRLSLGLSKAIPSRPVMVSEGFQMGFRGVSEGSETVWFQRVFRGV